MARSDARAVIAVGVQTRGDRRRGAPTVLGGDFPETTMLERFARDVMSALAALTPTALRDP